MHMYMLKSEYEKKSWMLVLYCWLAYATIYIGRKNVSVCLTEMIANGVIDKVSGGTIGTSFMLLYAIGQFINGWLGDHFHPRHMICIGLFTAGAMNVLMGLNSTSSMFIIIWGICGFACSMLWSPTIRAISTWTNDEISQTAGTSLAATIPIGTILCYLVCSLALHVFHWRMAFIFCGTICIGMSVILFFCFRRLKNHMIVEKDNTTAYTEKSNDKNGHGTVKIFCMGLVFAAIGILFNGMLKDGLDLWIPTVLTEKFIPSASVVSLICMILPLLNIFGAYIARFVYKRFRLDEMTTCSVMFAISTISLAVITFFIHVVPSKTVTSSVGIKDVMLTIFITFLMALCSASMLGANTMLLTFIPLHFGKIGRASTVTGMLNCFSYAAAAVSSMVIGTISESFNWEIVFLIFVGAAALGGIVCLAGHKQLRAKTDELDSYQG